MPRRLLFAYVLASFACGNAPSPVPAAPRATPTATNAPASSSATTNAAPSAKPPASDIASLCKGQPPSCKPRLVETAPFCGPTMQWQMQQAGISEGDPRATTPVKACTCDHCASDADCTEKPGGHCRELEADQMCVLPEKRCVYPNGPCAACPNACLHSGEALTCTHMPPPP